MQQALLEARGIGKRFRLHNQGGVEIAVLRDIEMTLRAGDCIALVGRSGSGKSTLMRMLYGNYLIAEGEARVLHAGDWLELGSATPSTILGVRRETIGYVSQAFHVLPRRSTLDIVSEPLRRRGVSADDAKEQGREYLRRLHIREALWPLSPLTFSGGEQQRVNIARCLTVQYPVLLLDEPTAALDGESRDIVLAMISAARSGGAAILCTFHDDDARNRICTGSIEMTRSQA